MMEFMGYRRPDGSVGIRNKILIIAVDECCEGIARGIARHSEAVVVMTNWYTCMLGGNEETVGISLYSPLFTRKRKPMR